MSRSNNLPPDILKRAQALDAEIASYAGKEIPPKAQQDLITEMLKLRVEELVQTQQVSREVAIKQAYTEFAGEMGEKQAKKEGEEHLQSMDSIHLVSAKDELLGKLSEGEREDENKKKEKEKKKEIEPESSKDASSRSNAIDGGGVYKEDADNAPKGDPSASRICRVNFGGGGGNGVSEFSSKNAPPPVGSTPNATTLNINGVIATIHSFGVHREMTLHLPPLPPNPTPEELKAHEIATQTFEAMRDEAKEYGKGSYGLLSHNCVGAVDAALHAGDPKLTDGNTRMPWTLDNKVAEELAKQQTQQLAQSPAIANGNITSPQGVPTPKPSPADERAKEAEDQQHSPAPTPRPPGSTQR